MNFHFHRLPLHLQRQVTSKLRNARQFTTRLRTLSRKADLLRPSASILTNRSSLRAIVPIGTHDPNRRFFSAAISSDEVMEGGAITNRLNGLVEIGEVQPDEHQLEAAAELDRIYDYLMSHDPPPLEASTHPQPAQEQRSFFGSIFGSTTSTAKQVVSTQLSSLFSTSAKGAYLFGGVGCGKTFLMNLLYDAVDTGPWANDKQKVHYHKFMLDVHQHMHQQRKMTPSGDLIAPVVDQILKKGRFLCLDEFQVTDVADALILQRLFEGLWSKGCILVATSNRPPSDLYLHGLQRDRFLPFIDRLEQQCAVVDLLDSETDYRMLAKMQKPGGNGSPFSAMGQGPVMYYLEGGKESSKEVRKLFYDFADHHPTNPTTLTTQGRKVPIPLACTHRRVAMFDFEDLCQKAMGAADYLVIANNFSTVFCNNVPRLTVNELNWLRRFITFVDTMYELKVKLVLQTTQPMSSVSDIFVVDGAKDSYQQDEVFAFDRTLSRLEEMSSEKYLRSQWLGGSRKRRAKDTKHHKRRNSSMLFESPFQAVNMMENTASAGYDDDDDDKVETQLSIHPSLDNHYINGAEK